MTNKTATLNEHSWDRIEELLRDSEQKSDSIIANNIEMQV